MNCCGVLANSFTQWFYALTFFTVAIQVFGFGLLTALFYLSQRPPFIDYKLNISDYVFGALLTTVIVLGFILWFRGSYSTLPPSMPEMNALLLSNVPSYNYLTVSQ